MDPVMISVLRMSRRRRAYCNRTTADDHDQYQYRQFSTIQIYGN